MSFEPFNQRFISCEGPDGCGKSTLALNLVNWLLTNNYQVKYFREPGGTPLGEKLRELILSNNYSINPITELFMFCAARNALVNQEIKPALAQGYFVVLDRFADSTRVYQGYAGQLEESLVETIIQLATDNLEPMVTFLPLTDLDTLWLRSSRVEERDRIEQQGLVFLKKVLEGYQYLASKYTERIVVLPANSAQETLDLAIQELKNRRIL